MKPQFSNLAQRDIGLDMIRGVVILAILIININYISTPSVVRYNPLAFGDFNGLDQGIWVFEYSLIKQRFMPILALLFGAGIVLFANKFKQQATRAFIKRSVCLALIGLAHAYLIWDGDVLFSYAVCGLAAYFLLRLSDRWLVLLGVGLIIAPIIPELIQIALELSQNGLNLSGLGDSPEFWLPDQSQRHALATAYQASWWQLTPARIEAAIHRQSFDLVYFTLWRCTGLMLLGMVMMRNGFLLGKKSYRKGLIISLSIGLPVSLLGSIGYMMSHYNFHFFNTILTLSFYLGTLSLAYAYLCLLILWSRSNRLVRLKLGLANVGRMALTLYIAQNLICAVIFYGWGFDLYAQVSRSELTLVTLAILVSQFLFAQFWMRYFQYGPLEALWRRCYFTDAQLLNKVSKSS